MINPKLKVDHVNLKVSDFEQSFNFTSLSLDLKNKFFNPEGSIFSVIGLGVRSSHIFLNQPDYVVKQHNGFGFLNIEINGKELDAKYYDIGYNCKEQQLKEKDLEEGDFTIYEMSSCKNNKKDPLKIIDHYSISKVS